MATLFDSIAAIIADEADVPLDAVTPGALWNEIGIDSLGLVPVLVRCECDFLCTLPDREVELLRTPGELAALVEKHRKVRA
jgi:acyl carrier protein